MMELRAFPLSSSLSVIVVTLILRVSPKDDAKSTKRKKGLICVLNLQGDLKYGEVVPRSAPLSSKTIKINTKNLPRLERRQ